ncbi:MAG: hypothetical protein U0103_00575 [Candidatus Obscuribacterales bacterium]|nr:hypothetical protein [Cyanobacteria bacterium SZAS LIN-5]
MKGLRIALSLAALVALQSAAVAKGGGNYNITDGYGDGFVIHHGLFGLTEQKGVQDRLGDHYVKEKGLFSNKTDVNFLGNKYQRKHGLIGGTQVGMADMLGDSIQSRKTWFGLGRRQTNVNLSGVGGIVQSFVGGKMGGGSRGTLGSVDPNSLSAQTSSTTNPADFAVDPAFNLGGNQGAGSSATGGAAATGATAAPFSTP